MTRYYLLIYTCFALLFGCDQKDNASKPNSLWHIFSAEKVDLISRQCSRPSPGPVEDSWQPTEGDIQEILGSLRDLLKHEIEKYDAAFSAYDISVEAEASDYSFQFVGLVIEDEKVIYVNGVQTPFLGVTRSGDITELVSVCDGGSAFFGVEYVVSEKKFRNFHFNGHA